MGHLRIFVAGALLSSQHIQLLLSGHTTSEKNVIFMCMTFVFECYLSGGWLFF